MKGNSPKQRVYYMQRPKYSKYVWKNVKILTITETQS